MRARERERVEKSQGCEFSVQGWRTWDLGRDCLTKVPLLLLGLSKKPSLSAQRGQWWGQGRMWPWSAAPRAPLTSFICSGSGTNLGACSLEDGAPTEHSRQSSHWVLGPQHTAGSTGAMAPSLTLPTRGQTSATHCSCLSQVRNLFLAHALLFLFSR